MSAGNAACRFTIARSYGINHYRFHSRCPPKAAFEAAELKGDPAVRTSYLRREGDDFWVTRGTGPGKEVRGASWGT